MNENILVIDDDAAVRKAFQYALDETSYHVDTAESGEEGISKLNQNEYQLIFLDLKMPGLNGIETLRKLRKINNAIPVYIVTAFHKEFFTGLQSLKEEGIKFELLKKPLGSEEILTVVNSVLQTPQIY